MRHANEMAAPSEQSGSSRGRSEQLGQVMSYSKARHREMAGVWVGWVRRRGWGWGRNKGKCTGDITLSPLCVAHAVSKYSTPPMALVGTVSGLSGVKAGTPGKRSRYTPLLHPSPNPPMLPPLSHPPTHGPVTPGHVLPPSRRPTSRVSGSERAGSQRPTRAAVNNIHGWLFMTVT